jgi:hypothetical protein
MNPAFFCFSDVASQALGFYQEIQDEKAEDA